MIFGCLGHGKEIILNVSQVLPAVTNDFLFQVLSLLGFISLMFSSSLPSLSEVISLTIDGSFSHEIQCLLLHETWHGRCYPNVVQNIWELTSGSKVNSCSTFQSWDWWCTKGKGKVNRCTSFPYGSMIRIFLDFFSLFPFLSLLTVSRNKNSSSFEKYSLSQRKVIIR